MICFQGGMTVTIETSLKKLIQNDCSARASSCSSSFLSDESSYPEKEYNNNFKKTWRGYTYKSSFTDEDGIVENDSGIETIVTSSEEEEPENTPIDPEDADIDRKQQKIVNFVENIIHSKYFKTVMKIGFLRRSFESFASTPLAITIKLTELSGILGEFLV